MVRASLVVLVAGTASAQPDMLITVDNVAGDDWSISAEFLSSLPGPLVQLWIDASFELTGDGSTIAFTEYNPAYDTTLGPAQVVNGPTASFIGNSNAFFGTPDPSNPLFVANFDYDGAFDDIRLTLVGQNSFFAEGGGFDGIFRLYQDAQGNPGELTWDVVYIPAPGSLALAPVALMATRRSRKET
ncbi:MAG: hypothetical protein AAFS11_06215 [Planctomycetota bacterium]